ncbi:MAG: serine protease [Sulfurovum sp.]|nr:MAG: serine protease [Sulfurovum sp.]
MKKLFLLISMLCMLDAKSISFDEAENNPDRELPTSKSEIMSFHSVLKNPMQSVVNISVKIHSKNSYANSPLMQDPFFRQFFGYDQRRYVPKQRDRQALGSGVILSKDGYIVTNNHVVTEADEISVSLGEGSKEYPAKLIGKDKDSDIAVIKIEADDLKPIRLSHMKDVQVGDIVFAIGNPFGVGETVTQGIVSAMNKHGIGINKYENFIQTDASINPGNSGGALVDSRGALIGINSAILSKSGGNHGIGFSIPVDMMKNIVTQLIEGGRVTRGYMGVAIAPIDERLQELYSRKKGAVITDVQPDGAAYQAGLKRGDLVFKVNDKTIDSPYTLQRIIASLNPGEKATIFIERDKKELKKKIVLRNQNNHLSMTNSMGIKGLSLKPISKNDRYTLQLPSHIQGIIVTNVQQNSQAYKAGFEVGDIIIQVENKNIYTLQDWEKAIAANKHKKRVYINRGGIILLIVV